jgi:LPS O-antigen subunit length determinant protein (WzzB/FepE family)
MGIVMSDGIQPQYSDEVDLVELIQTVWNGKLVILAFVFVSLAAAFGFTITRPAPDFIATSQIKPIFTEDQENYRKFNEVGVYQVNADRLLALFIEQLDRRQVFERLMVKHRLLDRNDFNSDEDFDDALVQLASSIDITPPSDDESQQIGEDSKHWTLSFEYNDRDKWLALLKDLNLETTGEVQRLVTTQFANITEALATKRAFELEDLETAINNAESDFDKTIEEFEQQKTFELEDLEIAIKNAMRDYERQVSNRVAFLKEQAAIARTLNVSDNTIETQSFASKSGIITNVTTDVPFYLRGYKAIEKELALILSRSDKTSFVVGLLELEQKKRALEQDKTVERAELRKIYEESFLELERQKRAIKQDKTVERAKSLFALSPIGSEQGFSAVSFEAASTTFITQSNRMLMVILAAFIGGIIGIAYVLVSKAIKNRAMVTELKP